MSRSIREIFQEIALSLWMQPASFKELMERKFLSDKSSLAVSNMLESMVATGWIYESKGMYHTHADTMTKHITGSLKLAE